MVSGGRAYAPFIRMNATTSKAIIPPAARTRGAMASNEKPEPMLVEIVVYVVFAVADQLVTPVPPEGATAVSVDCQMLIPIGKTMARKMSPTTTPMAMPVISPLLLPMVYMVLAPHAHESDD